MLLHSLMVTQFPSTPSGVLQLSSWYRSSSEHKQKINYSYLVATVDTGIYLINAVFQRSNANH